jgi:hypothetical protein
VCHEGHLECVRALIEARADVAQADSAGSTALTAALMATSEHWKLECVRALIEAGADVAQAATDGSTMLMVACHKGHVDCVRALIEARADVADACVRSLRLAAPKSHRFLRMAGLR